MVGRFTQVIFKGRLFEWINSFLIREVCCEFFSEFWETRFGVSLDLFLFWFLVADAFLFRLFGLRCDISWNLVLIRGWLRLLGFFGFELLFCGLPKLKKDVLWSVHLWVGLLVGKIAGLDLSLLVCLLPLLFRGLDDLTLKDVIIELSLGDHMQKVERAMCEVLLLSFFVDAALHDVVIETGMRHFMSGVVGTGGLEVVPVVSCFEAHKVKFLTNLYKELI